MEKTIVIGQLFFGPTMALVIVLCAFFVAYQLLMSGKSIEGLTAFFAPLAIIGGLFVWNSSRSKKN
jgi:hypothetical protein